MERLVTFGDSWSAGFCGDLYLHIPDFAKNNKIKMKDKNWHFSSPWPVLVADKLNLKSVNYSLSGCPNKSIISMLYDSFILGDLNPKTDTVIVLFSTWHREAIWSTDIKTTFNHIHFKDTCSKYTSFSKIDIDRDIDDSYKEKLAAEMFLNFYEVVNFLENKGFKYKIGWGFTFVEDFEPYIDKRYISIIKRNSNLINPMVNYCKSFVSFEKLLHPTQEDHGIYSEYLYKVLK